MHRGSIASLAASGRHTPAAGIKARTLDNDTTGTGPSEAHVRKAEAQAAARRRRRRWAVVAVLFPLFFLLVIALGIAAMAWRHMEFFRPSPASNRAAAPAVSAQTLRPARRLAIESPVRAADRAAGTATA